MYIYIKDSRNQFFLTVECNYRNVFYHIFERNYLTILFCELVLVVYSLILIMIWLILSYINLKIKKLHKTTFFVESNKNWSQKYKAS